MLPVCHTIVNPSAVTAGIFVVYRFLRVFLKLIINGLILFVRQPHHNRKSIGFCKDITDQLVFLFRGDTPSVLISSKDGISCLLSILSYMSVSFNFCFVVLAVEKVCKHTGGEELSSPP